MIYLSKEEFDAAMLKVMAKLDKILQYQKNFDSEIFCSLSRQEDKIELIMSNQELQIKNAGKNMKKK